MTNNTTVKGYKIDFTNNTIIMNYKFSKQAMIYGTEEYNIRKNILADFPYLKTVVKAGRNQTKPSKTKNLTYENMRGYINVVSPKRASEFEDVIIKSQIEKSPYKYVRDWFTTNILEGKAKDIVINNENNEDKIYTCPLAETTKKVAW